VWPAEFTATVFPRIKAAANAHRHVFEAIPDYSSEDFEHDLLQAALKAWPRFNPALSSVQTWLGTIAGRRAIDKSRTRSSYTRRLSSLEVKSCCVDPESAASWLEDRYQLLKRQSLTFRAPKRKIRIRRLGAGRKRLLSASQVTVLLAYQRHSRCSLRQVWRLLDDEDVRSAIQLSRCPAWEAFRVSRNLGLARNKNIISRLFRRPKMKARDN
jgi:Sigma-70 region 2